MVPRHALLAMHATPRKPSQANALADCQSLGVGAHRRDAADNFVTENRGILRHTPIVVENGEVRMTQTAVFDSDFNVL
jgi:hypothetical protein